ncbi:hypothetical protein KA012_02785 [Candidatus Woesebacteria bacterium]|nr:hypothetical protein [Candidatus Woesebacteria bacterium]
MAFERRREKLLTSDQIAIIVHRLAIEIAADFNERTKDADETDPFAKCLMLLCVLESDRTFAQELQVELYNLGVPTQFEVVKVSSYGDSTVPNGPPVITIDPELAKRIAGRDVLIAEDMIDSGASLKALVKLIKSLDPKTVNVTVLLKKIRKACAIGLKPYVGIEIPNLWGDGHGVDTKGKNRELPDFWVELLNEEEEALWLGFVNYVAQALLA